MPFLFHFLFFLSRVLPSLRIVGSWFHSSAMVMSWGWGLLMLCQFGCLVACRMSEFLLHLWLTWRGTQSWRSTRSPTLLRIWGTFSPRKEKRNVPPISELWFQFTGLWQIPPLHHFLYSLAGRMALPVHYRYSPVSALMCSESSSGVSGVYDVARKGTRVELD
jgi:hypothetical protein